MKYGVDVEVIHRRTVSVFVDARNKDEAAKLAKVRVYEQEQRTTGAEVDHVSRVTEMPFIS